MIVLPSTITNICFGGDIHGAFDLILYKIKQYNIHDTAIFLCGDVGFGFESYNYYKDSIIPRMHKVLKKYNNIIICVRGNHDNKKYYDGKLINTKYVKAVSDYTIVNVCNKNILCIGGGTSIDRMYRIGENNKKLEQYAHYHKCSIEDALEKCSLYYWEDEIIEYQPKVTERVDIICSHSAPSFCYPTDKGGIVMEYANYDETLLEDIQKERETLDLIYNDYKDTISHWYYGHFHQSMFQEINNVKFRLLDIGELIQHVDDNYIW